MLVRDIMTSPARYVRSGGSFEDVIAMLVEAEISSVPVVDADLRVVGIMTEADVLRVGLQPDSRATLIPRSAPPAPWPEAVDEVMTGDPCTVRPTSDVADVAALMGEHGWKSLPVVDQDVLVGVVSRSDILRTLHTSDQEILRSVSSAMTESGHPEWSVAVALGLVSISGPLDRRDEQLATSTASAIPGVRRVVTSPMAP